MVDYAEKVPWGFGAWLLLTVHKRDRSGVQLGFS